MRKNITNSEYTYSSLNDMYKFLNSDNIDDFLIDFGGMLKEAILLREKTIEAIKLFPHMYDGDINGDFSDIIDISEFSWIDDGEHDDSKMRIEISEK